VVTPDDELEDDDSELDDETDVNRESKVLLEGNATIAREYLKKLQAQEFLI